MSDTLVILFPLAMGLVAALSFIGCANGFGDFVDFGGYDDTVQLSAGLVAFWPLDDTSGTTAADLGSNNFNGTYTQGPNVPYDPVNKSGAAPARRFGQPDLPPPAEASSQMTKRDKGFAQAENRCLPRTECQPKRTLG